MHATYVRSNQKNNQKGCPLTLNINGLLESSGCRRRGRRTDRSSKKDALGADTIARIKDLHVLIVRCRGVGVETAENIIFVEQCGCYP